MADKVKVRLLRPLNGEDIGTEKEYSKADADRLESRGAVEIVSKSAPAPQNKMESAPENKSLDDMLKAELVEKAEAEGVEVLSSDTKADIIAKLESNG